MKLEKMSLIFKKNRIPKDQGPVVQKPVDLGLF